MRIIRGHAIHHCHAVLSIGLKRTCVTLAGDLGQIRRRDCDQTKQRDGSGRVRTLRRRRGLEEREESLLMDDTHHGAPLAHVALVNLTSLLGYSGWVWVWWSDVVGFGNGDLYVVTLNVKVRGLAGA